MEAISRSIACVAPSVVVALVALAGHMLAAQSCATAPLSIELAPGSSVGTKPILYSSSDPSIGGQFSIGIKNGPASGHGILFVSFTETSFYFADLQATVYLGSPIQLTGFALNQQGSVSGIFPYNVPSAVCGIQVVFQCVVVDPSAPLGLALTNGLRVQFGSGPAWTGVESVVSSTGAVIGLSPNEALTLPQGAISTPTTVCFMRRPVQPSDVDGILDLGENLYAIEPTGLALAVPARLVLPVPQNASDALMFTRDSAALPWELVASPPTSLESEDSEDANSVFSVENGAVSASLSHFSQKAAKCIASTSFVDTGGGNRDLVVTDCGGSEKYRFTFARQPLYPGSPLQVYRFLVSDPTHICTFNGKPNQQYPSKLAIPRNSSSVSHIVLHDPGNLYTNPINPSTAYVAPMSWFVRNVLIKSDPYAEYYVDESGAIYQMLDDTHYEAAQAFHNNTPSVGIEIYRNTTCGLTFGAGGPQSDPRIIAVAQLAAELVRVHHLPFDVEAERFAHSAENLLCPPPNDQLCPCATTQASFACHRFLCEEPIANLGTFAKGGIPVAFARLSAAARYCSIVGHGEIQADRQDPRGMPWPAFVDLVQSLLYQPAGPSQNGALIDTSAQGLYSGLEQAGGSVAYNLSPGLSLGLPTSGDLVVAPGGNATLAAPLAFTKVFIGENAHVDWPVSAGTVLNCRSFVLCRGATIRLSSVAPTSVTLNAERLLQLDGTILATGQNVNYLGNPVAADYQPVSVALNSGADRFMRIPSICTRGANGLTPTSPNGGTGGAVNVVCSATTLKVIIGGAPQTLGLMPAFAQRSLGDFSGYGGASIALATGTFKRAGIVTSGGSGAGFLAGAAAVGIGGNGGDVLLNTGTALTEFSEPWQIVTGAGPFPGGSFADASLTPLEVLSVTYAVGGPCTRIFPSGNSGGRGSISFTGVGGTGGDGARAGDIQLVALAPGGTSPSVLPLMVEVLNDGSGTIACPPHSQQSVYRLNGQNGEYLRVAAIGGSGGPDGGNKASFGFYGSDGLRGKNGAIDAFGIHIQNKEP